MYVLYLFRAKIYTHYYLGGSDHVQWLSQEQPEHRDEVECDPVVPGAATRRELTHQIKLLR